MILYSIDSSIIENQSNSDYIINSQIQPGTYQFSLSDFSLEVSKFNSTIYSKVDLNVKASVIVEYETGNTKTFSITQTVDSSNINGSMIKFEQLQNAFVYNPEYGTPVNAELVLHPYNKKSQKWIINFTDNKGGV